MNDLFELDDNKLLSYPKFMKSDITDNIYLMTADREGICIYNNGNRDSYQLGAKATYILMSNLKDYTGIIDCNVH